MKPGMCMYRPRQLARKISGATLIELIVAIVIIATCVAGITQIYRQVVQSSADPLLYKQAIAAAESTLEEIERKYYKQLDHGGTASGATGTCWVSGGTLAGGVVVAGQPQTQAERVNFMCLDDYNGFSTNGIYSFDEQTLPNALSAYRVAVTVGNVAGTVVATDGNHASYSSTCRQINVTVTTPKGDPVSLSSYRCDYVPPPT